MDKETKGVKVTKLKADEFDEGTLEVQKLLDDALVALKTDPQKTGVVIALLKVKDIDKEAGTANIEATSGMFGDTQLKPAIIKTLNGIVKETLMGFISTGGDA